jgi:hypothetical protein
VLTYVDDNFTVGTKGAIKQLLEELKDTEFTYTVEEVLTDYLSCEIQIDPSNSHRAWLGQPHMMKKIIKTFGDEVSSLGKYLTPGTPGFKVITPKEGESILPDDKQSRYRTNVGMLMYLVKHSRPDIMNAVRELTKVLGKATIAAYREMLRITKFVIDTSGKGLKMEPRIRENPKEPWEFVMFSDSDWAGNPDDRKSVGSYIGMLEDVPILWRSKSQKVVSLSSSEAEFYACAEAVKEVPFIAQLCLFLGIPLKTPVDVMVDNVGAIFMSENVTSSSRTRHMDTRWWFVNQLQEEGLVKVKFVRTHENLSDIGTKNTPSEVYAKHEKMLISDKIRKEKKDG